MFPFYFAPADKLKQKIFYFVGILSNSRTALFFLKNNQLGQNMSKDLSAEIKKTGGREDFKGKGTLKQK